MVGPETDWVGRIARGLEPFQRFVRAVEQLAQTIAAARDRGDFRNLRLCLQFLLWVTQQIEAANRNPKHRTARWWLGGLRRMTPEQLVTWMSYATMDLEDLRVPLRGRPGRVAASTLALAKELDERIKRTGELPTTAAGRLLADKGLRGDTKGRADYLVRVWRNRALKSR
jgi:hypothetical protein